MKIYIFPFLLSSLLVILTIRIFMKKSSNGFQESIQDFLEKEKKANFTTKNIKNIKIRYMYPNKEILPFKEYDENNTDFKNIIKKQNLVKRKMELEMAKLPLGLSNTELKSEYGVNNFEKITILEEHYNGFIRALFEWASILKDMNEKKDCEIILNECVRLEGDISQIYFHLSDIYFENNQKDKLLNLRNLVSSYELSLKEKILQYIDEKIYKL